MFKKILFLILLLIYGCSQPNVTQNCIEGEIVKSKNKTLSNCSQKIIDIIDNVDISSCTILKEINKCDEFTTKICTANEIEYMFSIFSEENISWRDKKGFEDIKVRSVNEIGICRLFYNINILK